MEPSAPMYPNLPEFPESKTKIVDLDDPFDRPRSRENGGHGIRIKEINRIRDKLEHDISTRKKLSKNYKKFYNVLHGTSVAAGSVTTALAGVTLGVMAAPAIVLPLAITSVSLGAVGTLTSVWSKLVRKRIDKHQRLYLLASDTLQNINELLSESLKDFHISDSEFKMVLTAYQRYLWNCKGESDAFSKSTLVEKDQVIRKLNDALNK